MTFHRLAGAVSGILSAGVTLAVGELSAAAVSQRSSPVVVISDTVIRLTPPWLKEFATGTFGTKDKAVLIVGVLLVITLCAALIGELGAGSRRVGVAGVLVLGAAGVAAALTRPAGRDLDVVPMILGTAAGIGALLMLLRKAGDRDSGDELTAALDRRDFLRTASVTAVGAGLAGVTGRFLETNRFDATRSRAAVRLPPAASMAPRLPAATDLRIDGVAPLITPNADFYRIDTAVIVPQVATKGWTLRIHGMVDRPMTLTYADLLGRKLIERYITLTCVSNEVGDDLVSTARFLGAPLAPILRAAGVQRGADQIVSRSSDGWTCGTPTAVVLDGRDAMLAVGMNGVALPIKHGFPVRMVVPGLYGYVSATKWLVDIELSTFAKYTPFWAERGYAKKAPIKTESRIDTPRSGAQKDAGTIPVAGVAWAQHTGISRVQVQVDNGPWHDARLARSITTDMWRQWVWMWPAEPGDHTLQVRASDSSGYTQTDVQTAVAPDGATGWHSVSVHVR